MKFNPGLGPRPEQRVSAVIRAVATGAAIGVALAAFYTFMGIMNMENCYNGRDDDGDGWVDQADADCTCNAANAQASFAHADDAQYQGISGCEEAYRLTTNGTNKSGLLSFKRKLDLSDTVDLTFRLNLGQRDRGGLGTYFALTTAPLTTGSYQVNNNRPEINLTLSLVFEIDTHHDGSPQDIADDHLSIYLNGDFNRTALGPLSLGKDVEDGQDHFMRIFWDPAQQETHIFFDDMLIPVGTFRGHLPTAVFKGNTVAQLGILGFTGSSTATNTQSIQVMNMTFSEAPPVSFPVEWLSFNVLQNDEEALLTWSTASEVNSNFFEVERSLDRDIYDPIGRIDAAGNTSSVSRYHFRDSSMPNQPGQRIYYRLRQVDLDGSTSFSDVMELEVESSKQGFQVKAYPNPASTQATLQIVGEGSARMKVMTTNGQVVYEETLSLHQPLEKQLNVSGWAQGLYLIQVSGAMGGTSTGLWVR